MESVDSFLGYQLVVGAVLLKYALRLAFRTGCSSSRSHDNVELRQRLFFLLEHTIFSTWGFYAITVVPSGVSWYFHPQLCWVYPPVLPSTVFYYFYIAKVGTHLEDVAFRLFEIWQAHTLTSTNTNPLPIADQQANTVASASGAKPDILMDIHHFATAALCILSYVSGYYLIGSLLMLIHDISDIPLDLLRIFMQLNMDTLTYISYAATLIAWVYFRIYFLSAVVLRTIVFDPTSSFIFPCEDSRNNPQCRTGFYAEMSVYVVLIGALWILHLLWFWKMILKGYRLLTDK